MSDDNKHDEAEPSPASAGSACAAITGRAADFCVRARAWRDEKGFLTAGEMLDEAVEIIERASERIAALRMCEAWLQGQIAQRDNGVRDE